MLNGKVGCFEDYTVLKEHHSLLEECFIYKYRTRVLRSCCSVLFPIVECIISSLAAFVLLDKNCLFYCYFYNILFMIEFKFRHIILT